MGCNSDRLQSRSPLKFFLLVFVLSIPFWLAGAFISFQLLPAVPVSAFGFVCVPMAVTALVYRESGFAGILELLKRSFDFGRAKAKAWFVPVIFLMPCVMAVSYLLLNLLGMRLPIPQFSLVPALALSVAFFISALGEELGWSGYAIDPLQDRLGALWASILVGAVWAVWHFIPLLEVGRSLNFIAWWSLGTVAARIMITWLYNNTGKSVFAATVFHALINLTWQLFPVSGSYYDPRVTGLVMALITVIVVIIWGPRTLTRRARGSN